MSGHTPGPWILDSVGHVYAEAEYKPAPFVDKDGVEHQDYMAGLVALPYGNNARLIAAAPELLAALGEADCLLGLVKSNVEDEHGAQAEVERVHAVVRAAIAKAEGRS